MRQIFHHEKTHFVVRKMRKPCQSNKVLSTLENFCLWSGKKERFVNKRTGKWERFVDKLKLTFIVRESEKNLTRENFCLLSGKRIRFVNKRMFYNCYQGKNIICCQENEINFQIFSAEWIFVKLLGQRYKYILLDI